MKNEVKNYDLDTVNTGDNLIDSYNEIILWKDGFSSMRIQQFQKKKIRKVKFEIWLICL